MTSAALIKQILKSWGIKWNKEYCAVIGQGLSRHLSVEPLPGEKPDQLRRVFIQGVEVFSVSIFINGPTLIIGRVVRGHPYRESRFQLASEREFEEARQLFIRILKYKLKKLQWLDYVFNGHRYKLEDLLKKISAK